MYLNLSQFDSLVFLLHMPRFSVTDQFQVDRVEHTYLD